MSRFVSIGRLHDAEIFVAKEHIVKAVVQELIYEEKYRGTIILNLVSGEEIHFVTDKADRLSEKFYELELDDPLEEGTPK